AGAVRDFLTSAQQQADTTGVGVVPLRLIEATAGGPYPSDDHAVAKAVPVQQPHALAQLGPLPREACKRPIVLVDLVPIEPAERVVLAIHVVVALLCVPVLVAGEQHRGAVRQQQGGEEIALLTFAQNFYLRVVGRTLRAAVPAVVFVGAVGVV